MTGLSRTAAAYIGAVIGATAVLWAISLASYHEAASGLSAAEVLVFAVAAAVGEFMSVSLPRGGSLSVSTIPLVAVALLFPVPVAMAIAAVAMLVEQMHAREPWIKTAFNVAASALSVGLSGAVLHLVIGDQPVRSVLLTDSWRQVAGLLAVAITYYILNKLITQTIVALASGRSFRSVVVGNSQYTLVPELSMTLVGELLALLWVAHPVWTFAIALPALVTYRTLGYTRRLQTETEAAVVALADIVDSRDSYTFDHSRRVAEYSEAIATALGLDASETELIVSAARVHDLGKIGIPDAVLLKPGRLTAEEMDLMRSHSALGAEILGRFELYRDGTKLARHHHEWYDGNGYPDGLASDDIPLGARIIGVADAFDAMTSHRPYRQALSVEEAIERLKAGQGSQFDPIVVGATLKLLASGALRTEAPASREDDPTGEQHDELLDRRAPLRSV